MDYHVELKHYNFPVVEMYGESRRFSIKALSPNPLPQTIINAIGGDGEMNCHPCSGAGISTCVCGDYMNV